VAASEGLKGNVAAQPVEVANPDAIDLDDMDE
jgi:pre-mRNA-splicing factor SYF1